MSENNSSLSDEQKQLEGYKALMQYGCQMSQDHVSVDRIFMPLSLVPVYIVFTSSDIQNAGPLAELMVLGAGALLLWVWHARNKRSQARLNKIWDTMVCIENCLGIHAYSTVHAALNPDKKRKPESPPLRDFQVKRIFTLVVGLTYGAVLLYMLWRWSKC